MAKGDGKVEIFLDLIADKFNKGLDKIEDAVDDTVKKIERTLERPGKALRKMGSRFLEAGERMMDAGENMSQSLTIAVAAIGAFAIMSAKTTKEGEILWGRLEKQFQQLQKAIAPVGIELMKLALEYMPPVIEKAKEFSKWFTSLDDKTRKWVVGLALALAAIGPLLMGLGAFGFLAGGLSGILGGLLTPLGAVAIAIAGVTAASWKSIGGLEGMRRKLDQVKKKVDEVIKKFAPGLQNAIRDAFNMENLTANFGPLIRKLAEGIRTGDAQIIAIALVDIINQAVGMMQTIMDKVDWGAVAQAIGMGFTRILEYSGLILPPIITALTQVFQQIPWPVIMQTIGNQAGQIVPHLAVALSQIFTAMADNVGVLIPALIHLGVALALAFSKAVFDEDTWIPIIQNHGWEMLVTALGLLFLPARLVRLIAGLLGKIPIAGRIIAWMATGINKAGGPIRKKIEDAFLKWFSKGKEKAVEGLKGLGTKLLQKIKSAVVKALGGHEGKFLTTAGKWKDKIISGLKGLPGSLKRSGKNAAKGLIEGLESKIAAVGRAARKLANKIKEYVGWRSPTEKGPGRHSDKWAPNFMKMMADGIRAEIPRIERSVLDVAATIKPMEGNPGRSQQTNYNITMNGYDRALTEKDMIQAVNRSIFLWN